MKKSFKLNRDIKKLLSKNIYYLKINRNNGKYTYEQNYHGTVKDPDGNKRNLINERNYKLKQLKYVLSYLRKTKPGKILDVGCGHGWLYLL